ncbi:LacI family transcriptional regulator [Agrobacterium larrymoorei]|uniref:LacI family DNA-binding transcriptional regulator n=1 Tax=Agrobacterium larrymoorei TaxID=160699 RepID=UPI00157200A9|nr:LacI family DNA-binding transcriptional regulator [Agrobacterium larrymoorei]NTJ44784.1 LacI family transcriptional regulator [Agrobacterium larrymoorei]
MTTKKSIHEIAKLAGVSAATVSRALQKPAMVNKETLRKVLSVVEENNFIPNAQARSFRQQSTRTVILLVRNISNPFYLEIFKGVEAAASEAGYKVLMADANDDATRVKSYIDMVQQRQADGIILMVGAIPLDRLPDLKQTPIVVACEALPEPSLPMVSIDNVAAAEEAIRYLVSQGHRNIAHISGPMSDYLAVERLKGYRLALEASGITYCSELVAAGDYSIAAGQRATVELMARKKPFTAIFASSDQMAIGAVGELRRAGVRVPDDISVVGFDDIILAEAFYPPLTTVHQPRLEIGRTAMELLIGLIEKKQKVRTHQLQTSLVIRSSVAPVHS